MREIPPPENGCWPMRGHFPRHFFKTYSKYDIEENPPKLHISVTNKTNNCTYLHVFYRQKVPKSYFTRNTISIATTFITTFTGMFRLDIKLSRLEWPSLQTERKEISLLKRTHWMPIMDTTKIMISATQWLNHFETSMGTSLDIMLSFEISFVTVTSSMTS